MCSDATRSLEFFLNSLLVRDQQHLRFHWLTHILPHTSLPRTGTVLRQLTGLGTPDSRVCVPRQVLCMYITALRQNVYTLPVTSDATEMSAIHYSQAQITPASSYSNKVAQFFLNISLNRSDQIDRSWDGRVTKRKTSKLQCNHHERQICPGNMLSMLSSIILREVASINSSRSSNPRADTSIATQQPPADSWDDITAVQGTRSPGSYVNLLVGANLN